MYMKKIVLFILLAPLTLTVKAQFNAEKTPLITRSLATDDIKNILSETSGGSITVTGVAAGEAKIEVYVVPNNYRQNNLSEQEIRQKMTDDYDLNIAVTNNKLTATAKPKDRNMNWKKALNFSFKIFVPKNVSADLSTSGGSISLTNLSGTLDFSTSGGSLNLDKVSGKIKGRTSGGSILVEDSKDDIDLATSGGSIHAKNCEGKLRLATSGGSVVLSELKGDIKATTSGGSVNGNDVEGDLVTNTSGGSIMLNRMSCNLETSTSGGHIHVEIKELRKSITISNSGGHIDVILPPGKGVDLRLTGDKIKTDKLENFSGKIEEDEITGKLNGGGTSVTVKGGGGRVYLGFAKN
jgi:DUF4097 and DUF4098 domain-containing protein YvlB